MNHAPISHLLFTLAAVAAFAARAGAAPVANPKPQTHQIVAKKNRSRTEDNPRTNLTRPMCSGSWEIQPISPNSE